ncbi:hypothetical protein JTE90_001247 [Oedothorax gibbosus]|uniref:Uncharacterized protein n=1 Tax=Oedothorax gibbosus TaxID=931172 RepID=A0AAV6VVA7_9ARAC|nr:hypothetical protein JTE90_001247 [Oedothorax gibbosus]
MAIGDQLYLNGRLDCDNSTSMALNLFALIKRALKDLDPSRFESQFQGVVHGTHQFYVDLGFNLQDFAIGPADAFTGQFKDTSKCNTD